MIRVIAARELRTMFISPLAWAILAVVQFLFALQFFKLLTDFITNQGSPMAMGNGLPGLAETVVSPLMGYVGVVLLFSAPMVTSRVVSDERRQGTLALLYSAPVSMTEIVLGKYLGLLGFFFIVIGMACLMPTALLFGGGLDFRAAVAAVIGVLLLAATFAAIGIFFSSLTKHPTLAGIMSFGVLLWLWLLDWTSRASGSWADAVTYLSMGHHFVSFLKGKFDSEDVIYYLIVSGLFVALTIWRLDADRVQQ